jgi:hypothetical protein
MSLAQDTPLQMPPGTYNSGCCAADSDYNPSASDPQTYLNSSILKNSSLFYEILAKIHRLKPVPIGCG